VSITATEETDTTVNVVVKSGGMDYDLSAWRGVLWYGIQGSGMAVTNTSTSYNVFTFDLPTSKIPTNGLYELQVFGVTTNRTEEWARGRMSVRLNPSKGSLPAEWTSYPSFYGPLTNRLAGLEACTNGWNAAQENAIQFATTNRSVRIFNPSNLSEYLDGAGNMYVVSNFWNMSFSPDFDDNYNPAQTNYLFTAVDQRYFEGEIAYYFLGNPVYLSYWDLRPTVIYHKTSSLVATRTYLATTNAYVLDAVVNTGASGHAYISHWATTNLIGTLALESGVTAGLASKVSTNDQTYLNTVSKANTALQVQTQQVWVATSGTAGTVTGSQSQLVSRAWQNLASSTNWTWTNDGREITLTGYNGPSNVIIPDMLDGLPVAILNQTFSVYDAQQDEYIGKGITSVRGGSNLKAVMASSFRNCSELMDVDLNSVTNIEIAAFFSCKKLRSINIKSIVEIGESAFDNCTNLTQITLPSSLTTIGPYAFAVRETLQSPFNLYFTGSAPSIVGDPAIFDLRLSVTNYVTSPTATGWGSTFGGMPVVRMPMTGTISTTSITLGGVSRTNWPTGMTGGEVTNIVRSIVYTNQTWGAAGTNIIIRTYWDATNRTFAVEEITP